jgi:hypothetical protein
VGGLQIQASASIGITPLNRASDLVQVMVNSDAAMYSAKKAANRSGELPVEGAARTGTDRREARSDESDSYEIDGRAPDWRDVDRYGSYPGVRDTNRYDTDLFDTDLFDAPLDGPASAAS